MYSGKNSTFMSVWKESQEKFLFSELWDFPVNLDKSVTESLSLQISPLRGFGARQRLSTLSPCLITK